MKKYLVTSLILVLAASMLLAQKAETNNPPMMGNHMPPRMMGHEMGMMMHMDELKLTDAQSKKIAEYRATFEKQKNTLDAELKNLRIDQIAAIKAENFTRAKEINKQITAKELLLADARIDLMANKMKELTKEQKEIMQKQMMNFGMNRMKQNRPCQGTGAQMRQNMNRSEDCEDCEDCGKHQGFKYKNKK